MTTCLARLVELATKPDFAKLQAAFPERYPAVLESAASGAPLGRYDILCRSGSDALTLRADGSLIGRFGEYRGFLTALDAWWSAERVDPEPVSLPFIGGWCLYLSYELAGELEPSLHLPRTGGPVAHAVRCPAAAVFDHACGQTWVVGESGSEAMLDALEADLRVALDRPPVHVPDLVFQEDDPEAYLRAVGLALEHIGSGDIYQANLSRKWRAAVPAGQTAFGFYDRLRRANPGPFAGMMTLPGMQVLSTSPERLVEVREGWAQTRPIAGTRARAPDDEAAIAELVESAKERAEHVMLIDLERNDLGRICEPGSVQVSEFGVVESYSHVHHLVSNVRGKLLSTATPGGVIRALFPGGTITGCPKVRCMELIGAIEGSGRGAYTGSFGYLNRDGTLDLNILIRTATLADGVIEVRAGAGIVADSVPQRELDETRAKARGLLRGLGVR